MLKDLDGFGEIGKCDEFNEILPEIHIKSIIR